MLYAVDHAHCHSRPTNHLDMESVDALVEGILAFEGGVIMVSHDARLIMDTESEVWVCEGVSVLLLQC